MEEETKRDKNGPDIAFWDERIKKDYEKIKMYHRKWSESRELLDNEAEGETYGNLAADFADTVRSRLIGRNFHVSVKADDPDFAKQAQEVTVMANSLARTVRLKDALDDATDNSLWANVGWIEVGHSFDLHSFDPNRTITHQTNQFNISEMEDSYEEVPEEVVASELGDDIGNVQLFDPLQRNEPPEESKPAPTLTFDPSLGSPWTKILSPFQMVYPPKCVNFADADYVTKLMVISRAELKQMVDYDIDKNFEVDKSYFDKLLDEVPGADFLKHPVVVAVTFIRRDRNEPQFSNWYMAHVLGAPDIVIKSAPNPYGGMIPIVPAKAKKLSKFASNGWAHAMKPYAKNYGKVIEGVFKRVIRALNYKWTTSSNTTLEKGEINKINDPNYTGQVKFKAGDPSSFSELETSILTNDHVQAINLIAGLAQSASGQTDIDRGSAVKKISARQTEALLTSSALRMDTIRTPIIRAGNEVVLKVIHMLNLFSSPRKHVFSFGNKTVSIEPGGNDFTTSFEYEIEVKDLEGPANAEQQLLIVQFLNRVAALPQFQDKYDWHEIANEARRAFGFGIETMIPAQNPGAMPGMQVPGQDPSAMLPSGQGVEHPERMLGDQGSAPSMSNALSGVMR